MATPSRLLLQSHIMISKRSLCIFIPRSAVSLSPYKRVRKWLGGVVSVLLRLYDNESIPDIEPEQISPSHTLPLLLLDSACIFCVQYICNAHRAAQIERWLSEWLAVSLSLSHTPSSPKGGITFIPLNLPSLSSSSELSLSMGNERFFLITQHARQIKW